MEYGKKCNYGWVGIRRLMAKVMNYFHIFLVHFPYQEDQVNRNRLSSYSVINQTLRIEQKDLWQGCSNQMQAVKMLILQQIFYHIFFVNVHVFHLAFVHVFVFTPATF